MSSSPNHLDDSVPPTSLKKDLKGRFIVFEGIDGSGKTTQLEKTYDWLGNQWPNFFPDQKIALLKTREPGATELGKTLRSLLLQPHWQINTRKR